MTYSKKLEQSIDRFHLTKTKKINRMRNTLSSYVLFVCLSIVVGGKLLVGYRLHWKDSKAGNVLKAPKDVK